VTSTGPELRVGERDRRSVAVRFAIVGAVALAVAGVLVWVAGSRTADGLPPPLAAPRQPVLPDLTMTLAEFYAGTGEDTGHPYLFFTATVANRGRGPFLVHAARAGISSSWRVSQRFREHDGTTSEHVVDAAELVWGGHGHNHWHVHLGASYELRSPDGKVLREFEKVGFCFFDQLPLEPAPPSAAERPRFTKATCQGPTRLSIDMGLSPGWRDPYQWTLPDQRLDISGLADGTYRLVASADPDDWFRESDEANNTTWAELRLTTSVSPARVEVMRLGGAVPSSP
jgi:hypothetical protein